MVLEDLCNTLGATHDLLPHKRGFLRNVFAEDIGDLGECLDPSVGFEIRAQECQDLGVLIAKKQEQEKQEQEGLSSAACLNFTTAGVLALTLSIAVAGLV